VKVLVVGAGGREHALAWKIRQSPLVKDLYCAPGNAGIAGIARCVPIDGANVTELAGFAASARIDLTVVGPELPLTLGIAGEFQRRGLALFGASAEAALIESSKVFAKEFMLRHAIPTASCEVFSTSGAAGDHLGSRSVRYPVVVKADGLAAGKGVVVCADREQAIAAVRSMMEERIHGTAGDRVIIEEFLEGREVSFFAISDGSRAVPLATCQDYKRAHDGDNGPNTGGMGGYCPSVHVGQELFREVSDRIVAPTLDGLAREGRAYRGVLYVGLMLTAAGPRVLEYNARFGDPEAQGLLPRMKSDIVPLLAAAAAGRIDGETIDWRPESVATVVLASGGYPGPYRKGMPIFGIAEAEALENVHVFHAGTASGSGTQPVVSGGRVLAVTALGHDLAAAVASAYEGVARIRFEGMHYRTDIARDAVLASNAAAEPAS